MAITLIGFTGVIAAMCLRFISLYETAKKYKEIKNRNK